MNPPRIFSILLTLALAAATAASAEDLVVREWRGADRATQSLALTLARQAFDSCAEHHALPEPPVLLPPLLRQRAGVFVSTMRAGAPRTCMGTLYPTETSTAREIIATAAISAGSDRRFPPVRPTELKTLTLIVSIVGKPVPISPSGLAALDPARDGLAVRWQSRFGVVLSGETENPDRMLRWARIRAGAREGDAIQLYRLDVVRFVENRP